MDGVGLYKVQVVPLKGDDFTAMAEWKRFNAFEQLYTLALSAYSFASPQLASNVPTPREFPRVETC